MDHPLLDSLVLAPGALFDQRRRPMAQRLTVHWPDAHGVAEAEVLRRWLAEAWPEAAGPLWLNVTSEALLDGLLLTGWPDPVVLELPSFLLAQPGSLTRILACGALRRPMALKGRVPQPAPAGLGACLSHLVVEPGSPLPRAGTVPWVAARVPRPAEAARCLAHGAQAVLGWPLGERPDAGRPRRDVPGEVQVVMDLIQRIDRDEPVARLDAVLRTQPALAFRLLRLINSPGFGMAVEVSSFEHAVMILGYQRLKRWLALLLASTVDSPDLKPLMLLALRRGLLMERLQAGHGDASAQGEAFICGVFSLLDRMLGQNFMHLLQSLPVPESVRRALLDGQGPLAPSLALAVAVETERPSDIMEASEVLLLHRGEVSRAVWHALTHSAALQGLD